MVLDFDLAEHVFLKAKQNKRLSLKMTQRTTDRLLFGDASDSDDELEEVATKQKSASSKSTNKITKRGIPANEKEDRTSAAFKMTTYGQLAESNKVQKQSKVRQSHPQLLEQPELLTYEDCLPQKSNSKRNSTSPKMPKVKVFKCKAFD